MKYSYAILGLVFFGMFGVVFVLMFESITINNESEYYVLKEAMEAAMLESVDISCFRNSNVDSSDGNYDGCFGELKISEQKFVENFTRRFLASVNGDVSKYTIEFYDIIEKPAKATVIIRGQTQKYKLSAESDSNSFSLLNNLSGILEIGERNYGNSIKLEFSDNSSISGEEEAIENDSSDVLTEIPGSGNIQLPEDDVSGVNGGIENGNLVDDEFSETGAIDNILEETGDNGEIVGGDFTDSGDASE